jgi:Zn-dependent protease
VTYEYESYWAGAAGADDAAAGAAPTSREGPNGASPVFPYDPAAVFGEPAPAGYGPPPPSGDGRFDADGYPRPTPAGEARPQGGGLGGLLRRGWPLLLLALTKAKYLLVLLKFKVFGTFVTMLVSLVAYAFVFGLPFAIGFIALLFIHEMGHALVLRKQGVKATAPLFIPFLGAVIGMRGMPKNAYAEAQMALGGPYLGSLGALACLVLWQTTGSPLFVALAYIGCWLNLFNLIPVSPLDGGRAMAAISPYGWLLGLALLLLLFFWLHSLFLGFILFLGGMEVFQRWRGRDLNRAYYELTGRQRLAVSAAYFGLAAVLALSMAALQSHLLLNQPVR